MTTSEPRTSHTVAKKSRKHPGRTIRVYRSESGKEYSHNVVAAAKVAVKANKKAGTKRPVPPDIADMASAELVEVQR